MKSSSTSAAVDSAGMLTVLEMAPDRNGCTAAIILMCPEALMASSPSEQANTGRCRGSTGDPATRWCSAMWALICSVCCEL